MSSQAATNTLNRAPHGRRYVPYDASITSPYAYDLSFSAGIVFIIFFSTSALAHCAQICSSGSWWYIIFALGAIGICFSNAQYYFAFQDR
jgi:hypothetical protein